MTNFYTFYQIYHQVKEIDWAGNIDSNPIDETIELSSAEVTRPMGQFKFKFIFLKLKILSLSHISHNAVSSQMWLVDTIWNMAGIEYILEMKQILLGSIARIMSTLTKVVFFTPFLLCDACFARDAKDSERRDPVFLRPSWAFWSHVLAPGIYPLFRIPTFLPFPN